MTVYFDVFRNSVSFLGEIMNCKEIDFMDGERVSFDTALPMPLF